MNILLIVEHLSLSEIKRFLAAAIDAGAYPLDNIEGAGPAQNLWPDMKGTIKMVGVVSGKTRIYTQAPNIHSLTFTKLDECIDYLWQAVIKETEAEKFTIDTLPRWPVRGQS